MARRKSAFLVNLWSETSAGGDPPRPQWRGSVVHLMSQERRYFTEMVDLVAFLLTRSEAEPAEISDRIL
jgi:hypothetical protein